jgi:glycosyltransferase involved in cell wall biosynthesis
MNSLFVTRHTPNRLSGRGNRTIGVIRALAMLGPVEVVYVELDGHEPDPSLVQNPQIELRKIEVTHSMKRFRLERKALTQGVPKLYASVLSCELVSALTETGVERFDRVIADGPTAAAVVLWLKNGNPIIYNAHNFESAMHAELEDWTERQKQELAEFERRLFEKAEESWLPSRRDLEGAAALAPEAPLRLVPNVVDVTSIVPVRTPERQRALFVADYSYEPNRHSARFLVTEVMPLVWSRLPQARLMLAGAGLAVTSTLDPRIDLRGFVEDLPGVYSTAGCALVPLLESGGSPFKLIEAMAYGLPVVATPLAAGGIDGIEDGVHFLEGEGAEGFADAIVRVLSGRAGAIGARARKLAESYYSIEALAQRLSPGSEA